VVALDFQFAAAQVERRLDDAAREARAAASHASAPATQPAEWRLSPRQFDWHSSTSMVVVDMARVTDPPGAAADRSARPARR